MQDFLTRIKNRNLNKKSLEALIMVGAFDSMGERGYLLANVDMMLSFNREQVASALRVPKILFLDLGGNSVSDLTLTPRASRRRKPKSSSGKKTSLVSTYRVTHSTTTKPRYMKRPRASGRFSTPS
jgi:DNA polymerase III alpha subunit